MKARAEFTPLHEVFKKKQQETNSIVTINRKETQPWETTGERVLSLQTSSDYQWLICSFEAMFYHFCFRAFEKSKLPSWVFLLYPNSVWNTEMSISHWLDSSLLQVCLLFPVWDNFICVNRRRNTWNVSFQVIIRKLVTLDALLSKYNVSEIISKAPFALILMALCEQIQTCTGKGKLYECAFLFEKVYERSQIKLIFYKIIWILCNFWSFSCVHGLFYIQAWDALPYHDRIISTIFFTIG